jgi:hypothetical protein
MDPPPPPPPFQPLKDKGRGAATVIFRPGGGDLAAEVKGGGFCEVSKGFELNGNRYGEGCMHGAFLELWVWPLFHQAISRRMDQEDGVGCDWQYCQVGKALILKGSPKCAL